MFQLFTGEDTAITDQPYRYLTVDEMKSLGDDSLPIDVTRDERVDNKMLQSNDSAMITSHPPQALEDSISPQHIMAHYETDRTVTDSYNFTADNVVIDRHPQQVG
jgi:ankyrin